MQITNQSSLLSGLRIAVIGAGPGGLTFAQAACNNGAAVEIFERAGDPRGKDAGYTDRSFNLTLNNVGRTVLGDERAWRGSTDVTGRAIHNFNGGTKIRYSKFGEADAALLTSIPRPVLRQNLVEIVEQKGANIRFNSKVLSIEPNTPKLMVENTDKTTQEINVDLIVVADGLHSLADNMIVSSNDDGFLIRKVEPLNYVSVLLDKQVCQGQSLHHIHFWHQAERNAVAIGLPNKDGSIAALLISRYDDIPADTSPFASEEQAKNRLNSDFPELLALDPGLVKQVLGRKRGRFYYKSVKQYVLGTRCVVVGDAGSASPPWAGFGANTAIYSADALARFMLGMNGELTQVLKAYEQHKLILADFVLGYAKEHGEFLNKQVAKNPDERPIGPVLGQIINKTNQVSMPPAGVELLWF